MVADGADDGDDAHNADDAVVVDVEVDVAIA